MQILQNQHHRRPLGAAEEQGAHGVKHLSLIQAVAGERTHRTSLRPPWQEASNSRSGSGDLGEQFCVGRILGNIAQGVDDG